MSDKENKDTEHTPLTPDKLKSIGVFAKSKARRIFFTWEHHETGEKHHLSFFFREMSFGATERLVAAKRSSDKIMQSDILAECLFADADAKRKLFTSKQLQDEFHPSFTAAIINAITDAQKKRN